MQGEGRWVGIRSGSFKAFGNVYALYDAMRSEAPVWRAPWDNVYVSRFDLVAACLTDPRMSHLPPAHSDASNSALRNWLIYQEGSTHAAIRAAFQKPFAGRGPAAFKPFVDEAVELHCTAISDGDLDIVQAFARAVPERVIARLLGVPAADMPRLRVWSMAARELLDGGFDTAFDETANAVSEMSAYFTAHAAMLLEGRELPMLLAGLPDLVNKVGLDVAGANLALLAFAGHETTVHLISHLFYHLAQAPDQLAMLRAEPKLAANAIAETLRLETPIQKICRWPTETIEIGGHRLAKDTLVVLLPGAANRDPRRFVEPGRFDLRRPVGQNLAFGKGPHVCIGRALAEMEARSMLAAALGLWSVIEPVEGGVRWMDNSSFRGLDRLVLRLAA
ncbi:putative Biotin biosynthesis cytochrome P450 [Mesorhizobium plurifarium]|uniref:Putative Biotin biosynthesis cytochrome P450 n=1 Tax=Mesorhizobium plurifarium TaxID=69974 RepID=A0A090F4H4_MESPL|nr:putative Biotin biosynthesis cytochrome P450 [Mesorhizobium plurifarium]